MGDHGVYMATAIALASDILASAATSATYAKNKNIGVELTSECKKAKGLIIYAEPK